MTRSPHATPLLFTVLLVLTGAAGLPPAGAQETIETADLRAALLDSARAELAIGRAWHATRMLRDVAAQDGDPAEVLLLARAESGWKHHEAVENLLAGQEWLGEESDGLGWRLLATAQEARDRWSAAASSWATYLVTRAGRSDPEADALVVRRVRALMRGGASREALAVLGSLDRDAAHLRSWVALELAREAGEEGDTALVSGLLGRVTDELAVDAGWQVMPRARLAAGDTVGTIAAYRTVRRTHPQGARHGLAGVEIGVLTLARGDTTGALGLLRASMDEAPRQAAGQAAARLLRLTEPDLETTLGLAAVLDRAGDGGNALRAYDRAWRLSGGTEGVEAGSGLTGWQRLSRARLISTVPSRRDEALAEFRALRDAGPDDEALAARNLELWADMRRRQGLGAQVATLRRWLVEEHPASAQAAEIVWDRGWSHELRGRPDEALVEYARVAEGARTHNRAGQARMRSGQIYLNRGDLAQAAETYEAYLTDFPDGRRWEEASYWAAWSRHALGDDQAARAHVDRILRGAPLSYYAVVGSELVGRPYTVDLPPAQPPAEPGWLTEGLRRLDLLTVAGLEEGAEAEEERLLSRAEGSARVRLRLAEALIERGRTITGINIGWALLADDHPLDERLARVLYPFPLEELVRREAAEWGVDPIQVAALIRQESAFKEDIVSHAGAIGLMQVMPPTGRELAQAHGPDGFQTEALTTGEVNLHLGTAFLVEMSARYDDELPLVLSAYNAGPTRATRWRRYPEASDWLRFTERIPFDETRGYVKNVRRNLGVYRLLYGDR